MNYNLPMIEIRELTKKYGDMTAVDGLSLTVAPGEILGLVGPNGSGKTTTLRCLAGILPPTAGTLRVAGHDIVDEPVEAKRRLAFVPDEPRLFEHLTVSDHLAIQARLYGVAEGRARAAELLAELGIEDRKDAFPSELSRGMKQKLMTAMALLHRPKVLIFDEPLTGLDPRAMLQTREMLVRAGEEGAAVIVSSHLLSLVEAISGRILILKQGHKMLEGTLAEIRATFPDLDPGADLEEIFMRATEEA